MTNMYTNEAFRKMFGYRNIPLSIFLSFVLATDSALVDTRHHHNRLHVEVICCVKFPTLVTEVVRGI